MNTVGYFEIQANNPEKTVQFYSDIFGWKFEKQPGLPLEYYHIETGGISGGLLKRPAPNPPMQFGTNAFVCSMQVDNFDKYEKLILKAGGQIALPKFGIPGKCWQGYFIDTDGNTFGLFQVDENAK